MWKGNNRFGSVSSQALTVSVCVCVHVRVRGCSSMSQWLMGLESDTQSWQTKETTSSYHLSAQSAGTNKWSYWRRRDRPSRTDYIFTLRMKQWTARRHLTHTRPDKNRFQRHRVYKNTVSVKNCNLTNRLNCNLPAYLLI